MKYARTVALLLIAGLLNGCAGMQPEVTPPQVLLKAVNISALSFSRQTFVLSFDVNNPNPFPLPVNFVRYGVTLDDQRFASGESLASFSVPARGDGEFAISVDLDLLRTAPQMLYTIRDATSRDMPYELSGELGVDIPFVKAVPFSHRGELRLQSGLVSRATKGSGDRTP